MTDRDIHVTQYERFQISNRYMKVRGLKEMLSSDSLGFIVS